VISHLGQHRRPQPEAGTAGGDVARRGLGRVVGAGATAFMRVAGKVTGMDLLDDLDRWRSSGRRVAVARVVDVEGSGPREPGAVDAIAPDRPRARGAVERLDRGGLREVGDRRPPRRVEAHPPAVEVPALDEQPHLGQVEGEQAVDEGRERLAGQRRGFVFERR
jgi:hypothetical protein